MVWVWFGLARLANVTQRQEGYPRKMRDLVKLKQLQQQQQQQEPLLVGQSANHCVSLLPGRTFVCSVSLRWHPDWFFSYPRIQAIVLHLSCSVNLMEVTVK